MADISLWRRSSGRWSHWGLERGQMAAPAGFSIGHRAGLGEFFPYQLTLAQPVLFESEVFFHSLATLMQFVRQLEANIPEVPGLILIARYFFLAFWVA